MPEKLCRVVAQIQFARRLDVVEAANRHIVGRFLVLDAVFPGRAGYLNHCGNEVVQGLFA